MPLDLTCDTDEVIDLARYVDRMNGIDMRDRDAVVATAPMLKALFNNRSFLLDGIAQQVAERMDREKDGSAPEYTPNVFILASRKQYTVRAVIWPPVTGAQSDAEKAVFSFELAHDHNFDFMTVGYYGPGYETDLYEYDIDQVVGYPGEQVAVASKGRERLSEGRILFFRKGVDIHTQLPPAATSISLNLLLHPGDSREDPGPQYTFDIERGSIIGNIHRDGQAIVVDLFDCLMDDETAPRIARLATEHPNPTVRLASLRALGKHRGRSAWLPALRDPSELVRHHARLVVEQAPS